VWYCVMSALQVRHTDYYTKDKDVMVCLLPPLYMNE
jgi:hypothetical protein